MIRLAIVVEGRTEEEFVKEMLADHMQARGVRTEPILLNGNVTVDRLAAHMAKLIWNFDIVTSLVDLYGFRDKGTNTREQLQQLICKTVDTIISRAWDQSRAFSYVQQYEFEGLLFSDVAAFKNAINLPEEGVEELQRIRSTFGTPEDINDGIETSPSKRILKVMPRYQKVVDGPLIALETTLDVIRRECPRFNAWVARMESLSNTPPLKSV